MAEKPPTGPSRTHAPTGPKVSGARTAVSLVLLVVVLIVCVIEVRAGLGQYLTLKSFAGKSENNIFTDVTLAEAQGMIAMFPSSPVVTKGDAEDTYHYRWYSLLRPLAGKEVPELYVSADHSDPPRAVSFYTSTEGEMDGLQSGPAADTSGMSSPAGPPEGMSGMMGGGMMGGGDRQGSRPGGAGGGGRKRPALEGDESATTEPSETDAPATSEPESTPSDAPATKAPEESDAGAPPATSESGEEPKTEEAATTSDEKTETPAEPN